MFDRRAWLLISLGPMVTSMARTALTLTTLAFALLSGCLGDEATPSPATSTQVDDGMAPETSAVAEAPSIPPLPDCPASHSNNSGTWTQVGDEYIVAPYGENLVVYYQESNGCSGMQTEGEWSHNPDTKVAEVPLPAAKGPSLNA